MNAALEQEINETFDRFEKAFSSIDATKIDTVPFADSWTAGQVGEHVRRSLSNISGFLYGHTSATHRPYDEKSAVVRSIFLDFNTKLKSPDFILPRETTHSKNELLQFFEAARQQMLDIARTADLTVTCNDFELPALGTLTRQEWLTFYAVHTKRHAHQLENIQRALGAN